MKTAVPLLPRAWLIVSLLWFVGCLNVMARTMITTMHASITHAIPMNEAQFGLLISAFMCVYGLLSPFAGFLSDRFGRSRVILIAMAIWSVVTGLTGLASTYPELLVMRILMALSEVCYIPAAVALIADYHRGPTRGLATGIHATALVAGGMFASVGGWIGEGHPWGWAFLAVSLPSLLYCAALTFVLRDPPREQSEAFQANSSQVRFGQALANLFSRGPFLLFLCCVVCLDGCNGILIGWLPTYMADHFHLAQGAAGFSATVYIAIAGVVGMLIAGAWADRWSRTNLRSRMLVPIIGLLIATPAVVLTASTSILPLAIGGLVAIGFFRGFWGSNLMPLMCLVSEPRYRATAFGLVNTASVFVGGLVIYFVGVLRDRHFNFSLIIDGLAVGQVAAIAFLLLIKLGPPSPAPTLRPALAS